MHILLKYLTDAVGWKWCTWNLITFNLPSTLSLSWQKRPQILFGRVSKRTVVIELNLLDNLSLSYHSVLLVEIASFLGKFFLLDFKTNLYDNNRLKSATWHTLSVPHLWSFNLLLLVSSALIRCFISNVPQKIVFL